MQGMTDRTRPLSALALVCTLKPSPAESSSQLLATQLLDELTTHGVTGTAVRMADYDIKPGVSLDEGDGDQWPQIREQVIASDILVIVTPTWMGHLSSIAQRVLERLDAELSRPTPTGARSWRARSRSSASWATRTARTPSSPISSRG